MGCKADGKTTEWQGNDAENKPFYEQKYMKKRLKKEENNADICRFSGGDHRIFTAKIPLKKRKTVVKIDSVETKKRLENARRRALSKPVLYCL